MAIDKEKMRRDASKTLAHLEQLFGTRDDDVVRLRRLIADRRADSNVLFATMRDAQDRIRRHSMGG